MGYFEEDYQCPGGLALQARPRRSDSDEEAWRERPQDEFALEKAGIRAFSKIRTGKQATGTEINRQV
ncbi:hypothetical protein [Bacillus sp. UNCCL13]|uniref:hypothetical protein n=1 Tax=Bacillus sp. UNCCL13 TaxID=1502772 RepID=UPI000B864E82|nr:hypothetical protein [Bacillus sp. UNCCL13]